MHKMYWVITAAVVAFLLSTAIVKAENKDGCMAPNKALQIIALKGEVNVFKGMAGKAGVSAVFVNPESGSWTVVNFYTGGEACIVSAGIGYELVDTEEMIKPIDPNAKDA